MPRIHFFQPDGTDKIVEAESGLSLMQAAANNMVDGVIAECGGCCSCATCHVYIDEAWADKLPPADEMELAMLEAAVAPGPTSRLSCQIPVTDDMEGLVVRIPAEQGY